MLRLKDENGVYGFHFSMTLSTFQFHVLQTIFLKTTQSNNVSTHSKNTTTVIDYMYYDYLVVF